MAITEIWYPWGHMIKHSDKNGLLHNEKGPAYSYEENGKIDERYFLSGVFLKKEDYYNIINNKEYVYKDSIFIYYFRDRKLHRENGPALEHIGTNYRSYWIYGQEVSKEEWEEWRAKKWEIKEKRREIGTEIKITNEVERCIR